MAGSFSRVVALTRRGAGLACLRVASAAHYSVFLGSETSQIRSNWSWGRRLHSPLDNDRPGPGRRLSPRGHLLQPRSLVSGAAYLEDADNVYYEGLLERIQRGNLQMIDVRDRWEMDEFGSIIENVCHIPVLDVKEALKLPEVEFRAKYGHARPSKTDDNIVFTSKTGTRSLAARDIARDLGFTKAKHYPGGWMEWSRFYDLRYSKELK